MDEEWVKLKNWESQYEITKTGKIRNRFTKHVLSPQMASGGYILYFLQDIYESPKRTKGRLLHRLLAQTFIPNPKNLKEVNHKDFDKWNNTLGNLEWVSKRTNTDHAMAGGRYHLQQSRIPAGYARRVVGGKCQLVKLLPEP